MTSTPRDFGLIHIPKTGGISIRKSFNNSPYHLICEMHKPYKKLTREQKSSLIFFCVVRNPFDRIYSFYHYFLGGKINRTFLLGFDKNYQISFDDFIVRLKDFHVYIKPSWDFISEEQEIHVHNILKFESLQSDFEVFCEKYDLNLKLMSMNINHDKPQIQKLKIYKQSQIKLIEKIFSKDFENFEYSYQSWIESDSLIS